MRRLRIAQVAPLCESVPPQFYGGTERVVSYLTEELVRQGHDVTLFASGDSVTSARLVPICQRALRLEHRCVDPLAHHVVMMEHVFSDTSAFDVIHFHIDYLQLPMAHRQDRPYLTTFHGRLDMPDLPAIFRLFRTAPVVSISDAQRRPLPWLNWQRTIYHGLPPDLFRFQPRRGDYLAFLGRISPDKRVDRAIAIAEQTGMPLKIAAKVDDADRDYFARRIEPLLQQASDLVEFVGEIGDKGGKKNEFLANARALLFPIDWPEPFGLVMIEAMACGTPTIAYRCGSVPEVLDDGVTGFVVDCLEEAVAAVERVNGLERRKCREVFEERFTVTRMVQDYLDVYHRLIDAPPNGFKTSSAMPRSRLGAHRANGRHAPAATPVGTDL